MKYTLLFLVLIFGCSSYKRPRVYPDLYEGNLLMEHSIGSTLYKKPKVFWMHNFKKMAGYGFTNSKQTVLTIDKYEFEMSKSRLTLKYCLIADSIGKDAGLNKSIPKFIDLFYFYDSAFLDSVTLKNYKLYKKDIRTLNINQPKVNRRSGEH